MAPVSVNSKQPVPEVELRAWSDCLLDPSAKLVDRARALWGLRHASEVLAVELLAKFVCDIVEPSPAANALLQHEAAYCLGQRGNPEAIPFLIQVVQNSKHYPVVRHEAAEALAALCGVPGVDMNSVEQILTEFASSDVIELAETCQLGLGRISWLRKQGNISTQKDIAKTVFPDTTDPAPSTEPEFREEPPVLRDIMMSQSKSLFTRYQALFSLRDCILEARFEPSKQSISQDILATLLAEGLRAPGSALLRHEVAFVLGQLCMPVTVPDLAECLQLASEHSMVRHEAAEALGAVLGHLTSKSDTEQLSDADHTFELAARCVLQEYLKDEDPLVRESCVLALDVADYVCSKDQFQYAAVPSG